MQCKTGQSKSRPIAGAAVFAVLLAGAFAWDLLPFGSTPKHPFDGHWKVTVSSLSGCRNNDPRSFSVNVGLGKIDEPQQPRPKKGGISDAGEFGIKVTDRSGNLKATQTGTITGDIGKGSFQGKKPGCAGVVTLVRLN